MKKKLKTKTKPRKKDFEEEIEYEEEEYEDEQLSRKKNRQGNPDKIILSKQQVFIIVGLVVAIIFVFIIINSSSSGSEREQMLFGKWQLSNLEDNMTRNEIDLKAFNQTLDSMRTRVLILNDNKSYTVSQQQQTQIGTWKLSEDEKTLLLLPKGLAAGNEMQMLIESVTPERLLVRITEKLQNGDLANTRITFRKAGN